MTRKRAFYILAACSLFVACAAHAQQANQPPAIRHEPVSVAVRGQPVTVLANVTDDSGVVKSVTLFYALSRDAAPFRVPMKSSGTSLYFGTIPGGVISGANTISYYIEALDNLDTAQETPWRSIAIKDETAQEKAASEKAAAQPVPAGAPSPQGDKANLLGIGIIAGGAAAVLGGAVLLANQGDSKSDSSSNDNQGVQPGSYAGSVTECFTPAGGTPTCDSHSMTISIAAGGVVSSGDLREGADLQANLGGNDFTLVASLDDGTNVQGEVVYSGTVVDQQRIVGTITGSSESGGVEGSYSGTFSAVKP